MLEIVVPWRKSSLSGEGDNCVEIALLWRTSSLSGEGNNCVEVAPASEIHVRDSKDPSGPTLAFEPRAWTGFVGGLRRGDVA